MTLFASSEATEGWVEANELDGDIVSGQRDRHRAAGMWKPIVDAGPEQVC